MKLRQVLPFILVLAALLLQACGPDTQAVINTAIAQTQQISELQTAAAGGSGAQSATDTPQPGATSEPTETPSITPTFTPSVPYVSVSQNTNCRTGPSVNYGYVTTANSGQQMQVLKVYNGANYVIVQNPNGSGECWLWLQYADKTDFSAYNLPIATQPPTPTPTYTPTPSFDWSGSWNVKVVDVSGPTDYTGTASCSVSGNNLSCSATFNPGAFSDSWEGSLNSSRQKVSGTFHDIGGDYSWEAEIKSGNINQFIGNINSGNYEFCGARSGSSVPDPCLWP